MSEVTTSAPRIAVREAIEGGTPYPVKAGDMLYVPKAMPHQFQVQQGSHMAYTVVKVTPVE